MHRRRSSNPFCSSVPVDMDGNPAWSHFPSTSSSRTLHSANLYRKFGVAQRHNHVHQESLGSLCPAARCSLPTVHNLEESLTCWCCCLEESLTCWCCCSRTP